MFALMARVLFDVVANWLAGISAMASLDVCMSSCTMSLIDLAKSRK